MTRRERLAEAAFLGVIGSAVISAAVYFEWGLVPGLATFGGLCLVLSALKAMPEFGGSRDGEREGHEHTHGLPGGGSTTGPTWR
jgi:hypothetical protein